MAHIDCSHVITDGMRTYPGLPTPTIGTHLSREAAEEIYGLDHRMNHYTRVDG